MFILSFISVACRTTANLPAGKIQTPTQEIQRVVSSETPAHSITSTVQAVESLNVRRGAGVTFPVIMVLAHGRQVDVIGACLDGWVRVSFDQGARHVTGWVNSYYLAGGICQ